MQTYITDLLEDVINELRKKEKEIDEDNWKFEKVRFTTIK